MASQARKIGTELFAFYRGWIEGLDLAELGERYLLSGRDLPQAKRTLRWLQDELIAAARRQRPAMARLLRLTPQLRRQSAPEASAAPAMSLEAFQALRDPDGFYSEAELIALFEAEHGAGRDPRAERRARRNARLIKRLRDALSWLEGWVAAAPQRDDPVEVWFDEAIAQRLQRADLADLAQLVAALEARGATWYRQVPRIGPVAAQRIQHWLAQNGLLAAATLPSRQSLASAPRAYSSGIVPLERLLLPAELSGASGPNRGPAPTLHARDDLAAIEAWLASLRPTPHTLRSYRGQAERFLLWMLFERGKALSSADIEDCTGYRDFLDALDPAKPWRWYLPRERWQGPRRAARWSEDWRPFVGRLSPASQHQALTILTTLFDWLTRQQYLRSNPWQAVSPIHRVKSAIRADHSLTVAQWQALLAAAEALPREEKYYRLRLALLLAYGLGLRLSEIAHAGMAHATALPGHPNPGLKRAPDGQGWVLTVQGKGGRLRDVPVPQAVLQALGDYAQALGRAPEPAAWAAGERFLLTLGQGAWRVAKYRLQPRQAMSESQIYRLFKQHFKATAAALPDALEALHLAQASTHWLRHTHATHALEAGAELIEVQENLGHSSVAVTAIYTHASHRRKKAAIDKLMAFADKAQD